MFQLADIHKKGELTGDEVTDLMKKINSNLSCHQIQRLLRVSFHFLSNLCLYHETVYCYKMCDKRATSSYAKETCPNKEGVVAINCSEFVDLFKKISARPDILSLFIRFSITFLF